MGDSKALEALFPGGRSLILCAMFAEPVRWWEAPALARKLGLEPAGVRAHVSEMCDGGVLRERVDGGSSFFQPNPECPVYPEVQSIITKLTARAEGGETILVVEDQPATARITRILLESWGYQVLEAHEAAEAVGMFESHKHEIQLLLTDVIMPGLSGPQLARDLQRRNPGLHVIFMSGYPSDELAAKSTTFLPKPFNPARLAQTVREELNRRASSGRMNSR